MFETIVTLGGIIIIGLTLTMICLLTGIIKL